MKTLSFDKNESPAAGGRQSDAGETTLNRVVARHPELAVAIEWMNTNACYPNAVIVEALQKLVQRGNFLPSEQKTLYAKQVLLSEFFFRWALKHRSTPVRKLQENEALEDAELRPFTFALSAMADERTFKKNLPRLAKVSTIKRYGGELGNGHNFSCFVLTHAEELAHRFQSNFDPTVKNASAKAVKYMELTAVSHYLKNGARVERDDTGITNHLRVSKRLSVRTKIAAKLAYLPTALSDSERAVLRNTYGLDGIPVKRMRIKDVSRLLGYPNPAVLSRKLYRLKRWVISLQQKRSQGRGR